MTLTIKQIQERADMTYTKFRNGRVNRNDALIAREFMDLFMDDLMYFDARMGKNDKETIKKEDAKDDNTSNQIKIIKSLRMNNPLWDIE